MRLHVIGDSHASKRVWSGVRVRGLKIICHHIGDMTCAGFGLSSLDVALLGVKPSDWVCFCVGEIDCRVHMAEHENWKELTDKIVDNYMQKIATVQAARVFVFSVPPAVRRKQSQANEDFPYNGDDLERVVYVRYMNNRLMQGCFAHGFTFFDVHDKYADPDGLFTLKYKDFCVHIADPVFITEFLKHEKSKSNS